MDWHARYNQQARWTAQIRRYLFEHSGLRSVSKVLEVGCGTGALIEELPSQTSARIYGVDIDLTAAKQAVQNAHTARVVCADGHALPFGDSIFEVTYCHFLLLWVRNPSQVLAEMKRVTKPGGHILALAEPDYGGRIDYPAPLDQLGKWQTESLSKQGADPYLGRKLRGFFIQAGITPLETGILGAGWNDPPKAVEWELEWEVLQSDLSAITRGNDIQKAKETDWYAWQTGDRVLFIPTFYCWGAKL